MPTPGWPSGRAGPDVYGGLAVAVVTVPDRGEPLPGGVELGGDHVLDVGIQRGVRAQDELAHGRDQRAVLAGKLGDLGAGGVDDSHRVVSEI